MRSFRRAVSSAIACLIVCGGCSAATDPGAGTTWRTADGSAPQMNFTVVSNGTSLSGTGGITVSIPNYSGDSFVITSGTMTTQTMAFAASLGSNPDGHGGAYVGSLSFSGTFADSSTISGVLTYTPPRTSTQVFAQQTVSGVTLTKSKSKS